MGVTLLRALLLWSLLVVGVMDTGVMERKTKVLSTTICG
jgi:hypothetical protein